MFISYQPPHWYRGSAAHPRRRRNPLFMRFLDPSGPWRTHQIQGRIMPVPQVKHAFSARERAPSQAKRRLRAKHRDRLSPFCTSRYLGLRGPCSFRGAAVARFYLGRSMRTFMTIVRTAPHILLSLKKEGPTEQKPGLRAESRPLLEANRIIQTPFPKLPQAITEGSNLRYRLLVHDQRRPAPQRHPPHPQAPPLSPPGRRLCQ